MTAKIIGAVARTSKTPPSLGKDILVVVEEFQEAVSLVKMLWEWQKDVQEFLPDGAPDRIKQLLGRCGLLN